MVRRLVGPEQAVDYGGQWEGATHYNLRDLLIQLHIETFESPTPVTGPSKSLHLQTTMH